MKISARPIEHVGDAAAFRASLRAWLAAALPSDWERDLVGGGEEAYVKFQRWWFDELLKASLATSHWPKAWGGEELPLRLSMILNEELARAGAPRPQLFTISLFHLPATLFAHGSPAQQARYISGVRERAEVWCQGFSEPGAGSDLAGLRTRAERKRTADGRDVYIVNGQKVWSSFGMFADFCLLLARTDPNAPKKQAGISYFILDMKTPGVTRRPIKQINGDAEFCELFLDDVEIPAENLIGAENDGWRIAQSTLSAERGLIIVDLAERMAFAMDGVLRSAKAGQLDWWRDDAHRRAFMRCYARMIAVRTIIRQMIDELIADPHMGASPLPGYVKILYSELLHDYSVFMLERAGLAGQTEKATAVGAAPHGDNPYNDYLWSYAWTISGGTNEILRNIIAERVLGLPR